MTSRLQIRPPQPPRSIPATHPTSLQDVKSHPELRNPTPSVAGSLLLCVSSILNPQDSESGSNSTPLKSAPSVCSKLGSSGAPQPREHFDSRPLLAIRLLIVSEPSILSPKLQDPRGSAKLRSPGPLSRGNPPTAAPGFKSAPSASSGPQSSAPNSKT